jgi:hypothetical protein
MLSAPRHAAKKLNRPKARVAQIAGELIAEHGPNAAYAAIERLNDAIDRGDRISRDFSQKSCVRLSNRVGARQFSEWSC